MLNSEGTEVTASGRGFKIDAKVLSLCRPDNMCVAMKQPQYHSVCVMETHKATQ